MSTNTVKSISTGDRIRFLTKADELEREMASIGTPGAAVALVMRRHQNVRQKGREIVEAIFWLGGAISRAHGMSEWGDAFFPTLQQDAGLPEVGARRALRLWDLFGGDIVALYNWYSEVMEEQGKVLIGDLDRVIAANRDIIGRREYLRKVEGGIERHEVSEQIVKRSGLRDAIARHKVDLRNTNIKRPEARRRMPSFKTIRSMQDAKRKLIFDPELTVPVQEVTLADGVTYELVASMRAKQ